MSTDPDLEASKALDENPVELVITFRLTEGTFHHQVTSAIEGGIQYWATVDVGTHQPGWRNYFTARIGEHDCKGRVFRWHELSLDKLKEGLRVMAAKYPHHFKDVIAETGDATTGDVLVQCALFGEIVYG
jgi:hypothetical protein